MAKASIERAAARLKLAVIIGWAILLIAYVAGRFGFSLGPVEVESRVEAGPIGYAFTVADLSVILLSVALFRLTRMLAAVSEGDLFSAAVVRNFRAFAFWLLALTLVWVLAPVVLTLLEPQSGGEHRYAFQFHMRDLLTVGISLILFLVARLLERARDYEAESREFI